MRLFRYAATLLAAVALPLAGAQTSAFAQSNYPNQPVKILVGNAAGSAIDVLARILAQGLGEHFGQQFVVENRAGAGGTIAADAVARLPGDGYNLLLISPPMQVISPNLRKNLSYDPFKSFIPITLFANTQNVFVINPKLEQKTFSEIVEYAKANPGKLRMGNGGTGSQSHLANLMIANAAGIDVMHVPYKGSAFVQGVVTGEVDMVLAPVPAVIAVIRSKSVIPIGVSSLKRWNELPDVPTLDEEGLKGFESGGWSGVSVPAGTPKEVIDRLAEGINKTIAEEKISKQLAAAGGDPWGTSSEEAARIIQEEYERFGKIIRDNNITLD